MLETELSQCKDHKTLLPRQKVWTYSANLINVTIACTAEGFKGANAWCLSLSVSTAMAVETERIRRFLAQITYGLCRILHIRFLAEITYGLCRAFAQRFLP